MTVEQAREAGLLPKKHMIDQKASQPPIKAKGDTKRDKPTKRAQNGVERKYDAYLKSLVDAGKIAKYGYESITLKLADDFRYTPDFYILCLDGSVQFHDTKGRKGDSFYSRKLGVPKIKMAAEQFPEFKFFVVWFGEDKTWRWQEF
jgi:hypothetical protein